MSYENPQRQVISNAPAYQNLQNTISSTVKDVGESVGKLWYQKEKEKAANTRKELQDISAKQIAGMQSFGDATTQAEAKSDIPLNLQGFAEEGKTLIYDNTGKIKPKADAKVLAAAQGIIANVNAFPGKTVELAAWLKADIDKIRKGLSDGTLSSLLDEEDFADLVALTSASTGNPNSIKWRMEKDENWNPIIIGDVIGEDGKAIATGNFGYGKMKNAFEKGGLVQLIPDEGAILEGTKKKANGVFEVKTTVKDGKTISEIDGRVLPEFLDMDNAKTNPDTETTTESTDGKMLIRTGIIEAPVKKFGPGGIAEHPSFTAAIDAEVAGLLTNMRDAYSFNNDVMALKLGGEKDKDKFKLGTPASLKDDKLKEEWKDKFKENFREYTLANIPPTQTVKNKEGEFVKNTVKAEKPRSTGTTTNTPKKSDEIAGRNYDIFTGKEKNQQIVDPLNYKNAYMQAADGRIYKQVYVTTQNMQGRWENVEDDKGYKDLEAFKKDHPSWFKPLAPRKIKK
jgi:hypothetical protein